MLVCAAQDSPCLLCETDGAPALKAITFYSESIASFGNSPSLFEDTLKSNISQMLLLISLSPSTSPCTATPPAPNSAFTISINSNTNHQMQAKILEVILDYSLSSMTIRELFHFQLKFISGIHTCTFTCLNLHLLETLKSSLLPILFEVYSVSKTHSDLLLTKRASFSLPRPKPFHVSYCTLS